MILIAGTVRLPPENIEAARPAMAAMVAASNAEDGCARYAYAHDMLDPGLIHISELWRDRAALKAHFHSPHMATWREAIGGLGVTARDLKLYEVGEGETL